MGYIKEPDGVTFYVEPTNWTKEDKEMVSEYIRQDRIKNAEIYKNLKLDIEK